MKKILVSVFSEESGHLFVDMETYAIVIFFVLWSFWLGIYFYKINFLLEELMKQRENQKSHPSFLRKKEKSTVEFVKPNDFKERFEKAEKIEDVLDN